jgi:glucose-6-phosphate isomerase
MQLPDETIEYRYDRLLARPGEPWAPAAELRARHLLSPDRLDALKPQANAVRGRVAAERELGAVPEKDRPLQPGFIDLPQKLLDGYRRKQEASDLGRVLRAAARLRDSVDRVVVIGSGGGVLGGRAVVDALSHAHHNELPAKLRLGKPRLTFAGDTLDNDALQDLLELIENTCIDPDLPEERWGIIAVDGGDALEAAAAFRAVRAEAAKFYGPKSAVLKQLVVPVAGPRARLRDLCRADGYAEDDILPVPDDVGGRFGAFTAAGLLPAAVAGLDVRALLLGAAAMTRRFLEEPFDRNPVLQHAAVNHLLTEEAGKPVRVWAAWSRRLEAAGWWYEQLVGGSLGKQGRGPTPVTAVFPRDLAGRGQALLEGPRDKAVTNLVVKGGKHPPAALGMAERNEDDLNQFSRKGLPDLLDAAAKGCGEAWYDAARPAAEIVLPGLTEHVVGQLLQMLMLSAVVEARLGGVNPYGEPAADACRAAAVRHLKATPNLPRGEVRDATKAV